MKNVTFFVPSRLINKKSPDLHNPSLSDKKN